MGIEGAKSLLKRRQALSARAQRDLSNGLGPFTRGAIVSENKIVKEKFFFPLLYINRYISVPIGQIWPKKIWAYRAPRDLSNGSGAVPLDVIVSEKKLAQRDLSNGLGPVTLGDLDKKIWAYRAHGGLSNGPGRVPVGAIVSEKKIGQMSTKKIWAYSAQRALSNGPGPVSLCSIVSEKKIVKEKFFFPLFYINRYISAPIGQIWTKKIWAYRAQRALLSGPRPVPLDQIWTKKIWAYREQRALSNGPGPVPLDQIWTKKIWAYREQRALSNGPGPVPLGAMSAPVGQIWTKKIWAYRVQRGLSNGPGPVPLAAIVSEKKIGAKRPLQRPRTRSLGARVWEKKIVKEYFFPCFCINRNIFAPDGQIWMKVIWAYRAQRDLSNGPRHVPLVISRLLLARSGREKYWRIGRKEAFPMAAGQFL
ncbi:hypothetical protein HZH68_003919 [Vespula germanica]|uniref:Uncharacterized protein n=1 Tax=Vespula germanica TaxID=30212 RepID=A0A834KMQ6_VESGE|nr:hypothetical protein HZH68_003919 [Vespula germanica]